MTSVHEHCPVCQSTERKHVGHGGDLIVPECIWECLSCNVSYDGPYPPYEDDDGPNVKPAPPPVLSIKESDEHKGRRTSDDQGYQLMWAFGTLIFAAGVIFGGVFL